MDMFNVNFGGEGFFGALPQKTGAASAVDGYGMVPENPVQLDGFAALLSAKSAGQGADFDALAATALPEAVNSESAFSVKTAGNENPNAFLNKLESLSQIDALLKRVGALLGLNIDMEKSLHAVDPENIPEEMVSQIADFLAGLKEFSQILQKTAETDLPVEINGEMVTGSSVQAVADQLSREAMKLELHCTTLDISGRIAVQTAILNKQSTPSGVLFAVNPKDLAGTQKIPEQLASLFRKEETQLEGMISSIRKLAASAAKGTVSAETVSTNAEGETVKMAAVKTADSAVKTAADSAVKTADSAADSAVKSAVSETVSAVKTAETVKTAEAVKSIEAPKTAEQVKSAELVKTITEAGASAAASEQNSEFSQEGSADHAKTGAAVPAAAALKHALAKAAAVESAKAPAKSDDAVLADPEIEVSAKSMLAQLTAESETESESDDQLITMTEEITTAVSKAVHTDSKESIQTLHETGISLDTKVETVETPVQTVKAERHVPRTFEQVLVDQVSTKLTESAKNGVREVTLVLKPELLGEVKITLQVHGDVVSAKLQVESQQVRQIVENNLQNLRDALAEQNLTAGSLDVNVGNGESRRADDQNSSRRRKSGAGEMNDENDPFIPDEFGKETGRRYGTNSVEYFA